MVWQAFIDDSGRRDHSPVLVLGGFLAPHTRWALFSDEWKRMLDMRPRLEYFKMNEAHKLRDQFRGWTETDRDERVGLAYSIIEEYVTFQLSCVVDIEALHRVVPKEELGGREPNPYYVAFSGIITGITQHQKALGVSEKISFIFDDQAMEKGKIIDAWDAFKANASVDTKDLLGSVPAFEDDKEFLPLQASDLIAWWVRKMATEEPDGVPRVNLPWTPKRPIPGLQMHWDEARLVRARDTIISSRQVGDLPDDSSAEQPC